MKKLILLMFILLLGCATKKTVMETQTSSCTPFFTREEEAAKFIAKAISHRLNKLHDEYLIAVGSTPYVPAGFVSVLSHHLASVGVHQVAGSWWLRLLSEAQDRFQLSEYQPAPREKLAPAGILVAVNWEDLDPFTVRITALMVALKNLDLDYAEAGEVIPGSSVSLCLKKRNPYITVKGVGFCNKDLPRARWKYSALKAAELDAKGRLISILRSGRVKYKETVESGLLKGETVMGEAAGMLEGVRVVNERFDPYRCEAEVVIKYPIKGSGDER